MLLTSILSIWALVSTGWLAAAEKNQTPPPGAKLAQAPDVKPGSWWQYKTRRGQFKITLKKVRDNKFIIVDSRRPDTEQIYSKGWNPVSTILPGSENPRTRKPHATRFSFPLWPGKKWRENFSFEGTGRSDLEVFGTGDVEGKVLGWEKIKVPAGQFQALKVSTERVVLMEGLPGGQTIDNTVKAIYWYAPAVQRWIKRQIGRGITELSSYELK